MERLLFEGKFKERRVETPEQIFDALDKIQDNHYVTIGYVTGANLSVPKVQRRNPQTNRMKGYDDYSVFGNENGEISGIVNVSAYNFRFYNRKSVSDKYRKYFVPKANAIRGDYGIDPIKPKENDYKQTMNYGKNGVAVYGGTNSELQGHAYAPANISGVKAKKVYYPIGSNGNILNKNGLSNEQVLQYLPPPKKVDGVAALQRMGAEQSKIEEYIKRIKDLKFSYMVFEQNSILWVAATVGGEALVYLNPKMNRIVNEIPIKTDDFLQIALNRYGKELEEIIRRQEEERGNGEAYDAISSPTPPIPESRKRQLKLTEEELKQFIKECVTHVLMEGRNEMGQVQYEIVDKDSNPRSVCGGMYQTTRQEAIKQLEYAKRVYPGHNWTIEAIYIIGHNERMRKNLGSDFSSTPV